MLEESSNLLLKQQNGGKTGDKESKFNCSMKKQFLLAALKLLLNRHDKIILYLYKWDQKMECCIIFSIETEVYYLIYFKASFSEHIHSVGLSLKRL